MVIGRGQRKGRAATGFEPREVLGEQGFDAGNRVHLLGREVVQESEVAHGTNPFACATR